MMASGVVKGEVVVRRLATAFALCLYIAVASGCIPQPPQHAAGEPMKPAEFIFQTVWFILMAIFVCYMFVWRPAQLKEDGQRKFLQELKKGDEVITSGGIFGRVVAVRADFVTVEIAPNVRIRVKSEHVSAAPKQSESKAAEESK